MNKSTKIAVSVGVALLVFVSFLTVNFTHVYADSVSSQDLDIQTVFVSMSGSNNSRIEYELKFKVPSGYYLFAYRCIEHYSGSSDTYVNVVFCGINPQTGEIDNDYVTFCGGEKTTYSFDGKDSKSSYSYYLSLSSYVDDFPSVSGCPYYNFYLEDCSVYDKHVDESILNCTKSPISGVVPWDTTNHYDKHSVYAPKNVVGPYVLSATMCYVEQGLTSAYGFGPWNGPPDYEYQIKFRIGDNLDTSAYYTELWADIPVVDNSTGDVLSHRFVFIKSYKTDSLYKRDLYNIYGPDGEGGTVEIGQTVDKGYHFEINDTWNATFGKVIDSGYAASYGGITVYLRNAVYSFSDALVSDYSYFSFNPKNSYLDGDGKYPIVTIERPENIYQHTGGTFDENQSSNNDSKGDVIKDNDDSSTVIVDSSVGNGNSGNSSSNPGGLYIPSGKWSISQFAEWVNNGFGLLGDNGVISLIGKLFAWLPSDIFNLLMWSVFCGAIIAVVKLVF